MQRRAGRTGRFGGLGASLGGIWGGIGGLDDDDDDDEQRPAGILGGSLLSVGAGTSADAVGEGTSSRRRRGDLDGGVGGWGLVTGLTADLRSGGELPEGLEVIGGDATFEEQEDGDQALVVPEGASLRLTVNNISPWGLEDDGKLHRYSVMLAMRLDRLPAAAMPLFNGGPPANQGEQLEHVQARALSLSPSLSLSLSRARARPPLGVPVRPPCDASPHSGPRRPRHAAHSTHSPPFLCLSTCAMPRPH